MTIRLLINELDRLIRTDGRCHAVPLVRSWLGADAIVEAGTGVDGCEWDWPDRLHHHLADPEAAGWALLVARHLEAFSFDLAIGILQRLGSPDGDEVAAEYVTQVFARQGAFSFGGQA